MDFAALSGYCKESKKAIKGKDSSKSFTINFMHHIVLSDGFTIPNGFLTCVVGFQELQKFEKPRDSSFRGTAARGSDNRARKLLKRNHSQRTLSKDQIGSGSWKSNAGSSEHTLGSDVHNANRSFSPSEQSIAVTEQPQQVDNLSTEASNLNPVASKKKVFATHYGMEESDIIENTEHAGKVLKVPDIALSSEDEQLPNPSRWLKLSKVAPE